MWDSFLELYSYFFIQIMPIAAGFIAIMGAGIAVFVAFAYWGDKH